MRNPPELRSARHLTGVVVSALAVATMAVVLAACVPGGFRISSVGFSFSPGGIGIGFGAGGLFNTGQSGGSSVALDDPNDPTRLLAATFHNEIRCEDRIGLDWGQGFLDVATGACYACPEGYSRVDATVPVTEPFACKQNGGGLFQAAESLGPQGCDIGTFQLGNACFSCPIGTVSTGSDDPGSACLVSVAPQPVGDPAMTVPPGSQGG